MSWEVHPYRGLGPLRFGQSRSEARRELGDGYSSFLKGPGSTSATDAWDQLGVHLYFDGDDRLEFIEVFPPCEPAYMGIRLLESDLKTLLAELEELALDYRYDEPSYFFDDLGLAIVAGVETVEGVSFYREGYYDS